MAQTQRFSNKSTYSKELFSWQEASFAFVVLAMICTSILAYGVSLRLTGT